VKGFNSSVCQ